MSPVARSLSTFHILQMHQRFVYLDRASNMAYSPLIHIVLVYISHAFE
uniref:Uncharacterized protein n=1 Tax=Parascaris equorum TaxID=6256 RepID=A0A914R3Q0_PAREQ